METFRFDNFHMRKKESSMNNFKKKKKKRSNQCLLINSDQCPVEISGPAYFVDFDMYVNI